MIVQQMIQSVSTLKLIIMKDKNRGISPILNSSANSVVTQPVMEPRSIRRTQKIKALHMEFQQLKKKIKDVESKNGKIMEEISKDHDFKKKQPKQHHEQINPIVYYQRSQDNLQLAIERKTHKKDSSDGDYKGHIKKNSNIKKNTKEPNLQKSQQYTKNYLQERQPYDSVHSTTNLFYRAPLPTASPYAYSPPRGSQYYIPQQQQVHINQFNGLNPYQLSIQFPNQTRSLEQSTYQYEQALKIQREKIAALQKELEKRKDEQANIKKLQKKYNSLAADYNETVQLCLQEFFEKVLKKRLAQIDKHVKKNENKVKKIQLKIKDKEQQRRSKKLLHQHREKRSQSRSKKSNSPLDPLEAISYATKRQSSKRSTVEKGTKNEILSKQSESYFQSQQFQQIASKYQQIIQTKTKENEQCEARLRQKQKQLVEARLKCQQLQVKIADLIDIPKVTKQRKNSQREENLLANLIFDNDADIQISNKKVEQLQAALSIHKKQLIVKNSEIFQHQNKLSEYLAKIRKSQQEIIRLKQQFKRSQKDKKHEESVQKKIKMLEQDIKYKTNEFCLLKERYTKLQNEKITKQCENLTLNNKIKKLQGQLELNQQKIHQLQKIIQSSTGSETGDLLEKSICIQKIDQRDIHLLQDQKERLEQELRKEREKIYLLQKNNQKLNLSIRQLQSRNSQLKEQIQSLQIQNQNMRVSLRVQTFEKYIPQTSSKPLQKFLEEEDLLSQQEQSHITNELQNFKRKYQQSQHLLKNQNQKTFEQNRKVLKLTSELNYYKEQLSQRQAKHQKVRRQHQETKCQIRQLQQQLQAKECDLQVQKKINAQKIKQLQNQWHQYQLQIKNNHDLDNSHHSQENQLRTSHLTENSFISNYKSTYNNVNAQNQRLQERLKQAEKIIQLQKEMDERILSQYRNNVQKIKSQLREKTKQNDAFNQQNDMLKRKIKSLEERSIQHQSRMKNQSQQQEAYQRIFELQKELNSIREVSLKKQGLQQQLYDQINAKQKEVESKILKINAQQQKIQQLQDLLELKEINLNSMSIQPKPKMRQSMQSHNSLKYSMLSSHTNRDRTIQLDLSQVTQSVYDHSVIQNVSQVFAREEFPYEKMNLKRIEQRRLFQKTAAYIKSLKNVIQQKNKKIKLLEKQIKQLRSSELVRKNIYQIKTNNNNESDVDSDDIDSFKDYLSVQVESTNNIRYKIKQLQHQTKLTIEQNNLLNVRVQSLQEQLIKAEEQEDDLMKMKDLYKDEMKNMVKKHQELIKGLEQQLKQQKHKNQQSESIQKMEALKQIFIKIVTAYISIGSQSSKRKKEEKKKELRDFIKVAINLFSYDAQISEKMISLL